MKTLFTILFTFCICCTLSAQSVSGKLTLNGESETNLELETNSAVQLFKEFKTGKYKLKFDFKTDGVPKNIYDETIVLFDFITVIKKDGKIVKKNQRKQPIPYFPGEMFLPAEAFDFIGALVVTSWDDMQKKEDLLGVMPEGNYSVELMLRPVGFKGEIKPVGFSFMLRKRPGRTKY